MIILLVINAVRKFKVMYIMYQYPGKMCENVHYLKSPDFLLCNGFYKVNMIFLFVADL